MERPRLDESKMFPKSKIDAINHNSVRVKCEQARQLEMEERRRNGKGKERNDRRELGEEEEEEDDDDEDGKEDVEDEFGGK